MKFAISALVLALALVPAKSAFAQDPPADTRVQDPGAQVEDVIRESGIAEALEGLAAASAPEIERTMEQLAGTLGALASRAANDPELRGSALRAAGGLLEIAHLVLVEQTGLLQEALSAAAERLEKLRLPAEAVPAPR